MPRTFEFCRPSESISNEQLIQMAPHAANVVYVLNRFYQILMNELTHNVAGQNFDWSIPSTSISEQLDNFIPADMFNEVLEATRINRSNGIYTFHQINLDVIDSIATISRRYFQDPECQHDCLLVQSFFYGGLLKLCYDNLLIPPRFEMPSFNAGSSNMLQVIRGFNIIFDSLQDVINQMEQRAHRFLTVDEPLPHHNEEQKSSRNEEQKPPRKEELILVPYNYGLSDYLYDDSIEL